VNNLSALLAGEAFSGIVMVCSWRTEVVEGVSSAGKRKAGKAILLF
jgi:hypothetical protein